MSAATLEHPQHPAGSMGALSQAISRVWPAALLVLMAVLHVHLALTRSINWDEFWFYSQVEALAQARNFQPLQTLHTQMFAWWLPQLGGTAVEQILTARWVMLGFTAIASAAIFVTARKISNDTAAYLAVAAYLGGGFVLNHAASFRVDAIAAATLGSALAVAMCTRLRAPAILALGALIAVSALVTIKFVLWFPAFLGIALWRWEEEGFDWRYVARWVAAGLVAAVMGAALYLWHSAAAEAGQAAVSTTSYAGRSAAKMFGLFHSPYLYLMRHAALFAVPLALAVVLAPVLIARDKRSVAKRAALALLWFPVLTPLFYHNSAPYFYVFILPPVAIAASVSFAFLAERYGAPMCAAAIASFAMMAWVTNEEPVTQRQHALLSAIDETFAEPVAYFDCCGMIGRFTKANGFMTPWGIEGYRASGEPRFAGTMEEQPVPLLFDNEQMFAPLFESDAPTFFHPDDEAALRSNYRHFWGDLYLAGHDLEAGETINWNVLVPGTYTASAPLIIDGARVEAGATVELARGSVAISNPLNEPAYIMWGDNIAAPQMAAPSDYWGGF
ncbi:hypothetical protein MWU38_12475 [Qipengyuania sp. S6317L1]|uniref:hypothetical protein n=1 Tax=Qipengyuania sp. S6317L1 TaxID=2926410 RepID=UPI001FF6C4B8|nr:hypothetical protein [Qipengyuania sp. S6317L1]MCK0100200.1 hypothetical protein [Qipengyuania sp. S6317L1]